MGEWPDRVGWDFIYERIVKRPWWLPMTLPGDEFRLAEVRTDRVGSPEHAADEAVVAEYAAVGPANMLPIVLGAALLAIDGTHRLAAARRRSDETVRAYILKRPGPREERAARRAAPPVSPGPSLL